MLVNENVQTERVEDLQTEKPKTRKRGFAAMDAERIKEVTSLGGKTVSRNRDHMATIGQRGGHIVSRDRKHMAEIGRKGGLSSKLKKQQQSSTDNPGLA